MSSEQTIGQDSTQNGNKPDWAAWLDEHGPGLMLYARSQTRSEEDAEDVLQTALVELVQVVESGKFRGTPEQWRAYVLRCIRHDAQDLGTRYSNRRHLENRMAEQSNNIVEERPWLTHPDDAKQNSAAVERALLQLREDYMEIVILHIWHELTFREIAHITNAPLQTVATRYRAAMRDFRKLLENEHFND